MLDINQAMVEVNDCESSLLRLKGRITQSNENKATQFIIDQLDAILSEVSGIRTTLSKMRPQQVLKG